LKSAVFESEEYESIVDTGTTVTIEPKTHSSQRVDPRERIKISGFDGHVTQSLGVARGTVAFGTNRSGASVRLKMPASHLTTPGAFAGTSRCGRSPAFAGGTVSLLQRQSLSCPPVAFRVKTSTRTASGRGWLPEASLSPPLTETLTRRTHPLWLIRRYERSSL
jgi:hypothetical protein